MSHVYNSKKYNFHNIINGLQMFFNDDGKKKLFKIQNDLELLCNEYKFEANNFQQNNSDNESECSEKLELCWSSGNKRVNCKNILVKMNKNSQEKFNELIEQDQLNKVLYKATNNSLFAFVNFNKICNFHNKNHYGDEIFANTIKKESLNRIKNIFNKERSSVVKVKTLDFVKQSIKNLKSNCDFKDFLKNNDLNSLKVILSDKIKKTYSFIYSEYLISAIFVNLLIDFGIENEWKDIQLVSVDSKMEKLNGIKISNFRCDCIFIYNGILYIVEFKYIYNRPLSTEDAINVIFKRKYKENVHLYLKKNYNIEFKSTKLLGISYVAGNEGIFLDISLKDEDEYLINEPIKLNHNISDKKMNYDADEKNSNFDIIDKSKETIKLNFDVVCDDEFIDKKKKSNFDAENNKFIGRKRNLSTKKNS
jgi:hypothetical protein